MKSNNSHLHNNIAIYAVTAVLSLILSLYATITDDLVNVDGLLYFEAAQAYIDGGISAASQLFGLPLFPILIAKLHTLLGIDLHIAAYAINITFFATISTTFVLLYAEITQSKSLSWIPAIFILTIPTVNGYREYIIRDPGFWALMLIGLLFFIKYTSKLKHKDAVLWQAFSALATLFRIEGIAFITLAPLYFFIEPQFRTKAFSHIFRTNWIFILAALCILIAFRTDIQEIFSASQSWNTHLSYMQPTSLFTRISDMADKVKELMPHLSSKSEALLIISMGILSLVIIKIITNAHVVYVAITSYGIAKWPLRLTPQSMVVLYFAAISFITLLVIAGNQFFLSSRYTVFIVLLLSLITCQYFSYFFHTSIRNHNRLAITASCIFLIALFLDNNISTGASKANLKIASRWFSENISESAKIACNEPRFVYYSGNRCIYSSNFSNRIRKHTLRTLAAEYDYLVLWVKRNDTAMNLALQNTRLVTLIQSFANKKGDEARIYQLH